MAATSGPGLPAPESTQAETVASAGPGKAESKPGMATMATMAKLAAGSAKRKSKSDIPEWKQVLPENIFGIMMYAEKEENLAKLLNLPCAMWIQAMAPQLVDAAVQKGCLYVISKLGHEDLEAGRKDAVDAVLAAMTHHNERLQVQVQGCNAIANLVKVEENRLYFNEVQGHVPLLAALKKFNDDLTLSIACCTTLLCLTEGSPMYQKILCEGDSVNTLIKCLQKHKKNALLATKFIRVFRSMTDQRQAVDRLGVTPVIDDVVQTMAIHIDHVEIQQDAASFLAKMIDRHKPNQQTASKAMAIQVANQSLRYWILGDGVDPETMDEHMMKKLTHPGVPVWKKSLLKWGFLLLARLTLRSYENQQLFADIEGIDTLIRVLRMPDDGIRDVDCIREAGTLLEALCDKHVDNQTALVEAGILPAFVPFLRQYSDDVGVQREGCHGIYKLIWNHKAAKDQAEAVDLIAILLVNMQVHVLDEEVCAWGCGAIWGLCENHPRNIEATWSAYGFDVIQHAMSTHDTSAEVQFYGNKVLYWLGTTRARNTSSFAKAPLFIPKKEVAQLLKLGIADSVAGILRSEANMIPPIPDPGVDFGELGDVDL
jgi:hypothetical protein